MEYDNVNQYSLLYTDMGELVYKCFDLRHTKNLNYKNKKIVMNKKQVFIFLFLSVFLLPLAAAKSTTAGISPDNAFLWRIELIIEKIDVSLTSDTSIKIEKEFSYAEERLAEVEKMFRWEKQSAAEEAREKHVLLLDKIEERVVNLQKKDAEKELEYEVHIGQRIILYGENSATLVVLLEQSAATEEQKTLTTDLLMKHEEKIHKIKTALADKREETHVRLQANGLSAEAIEQLEEKFKESINEESDEEEQSTAESVNTTVNESVETNESVAIADTVEGIVAVVEDTSTKSTVRVDGDVSAEQMEMIAAVYDQLESEGTAAEIEITVLQMENGYWKIEKEIDGTLSSSQQQKINTLVASLQQNTAYCRIKIKYDPSDATTSGFATGTSEDGVGTTVVIG